MGKGSKEIERQQHEQRLKEQERKRSIESGIKDVNTTFARLLNPDFETVPLTPEQQKHNDALKKAKSSNLGGKIKGNEIKPDANIDLQNSPFLKAIEESYLGFATPEIERQTQDAREQVTKQLARRGMLESSVAAEKEGDIQRQRSEALARAAQRAAELRAGRAGELEKSRANIISQLEASANAPAAAQAAINAAQVAQGTQEFEPLGQVFDVALSTGADVLRKRSEPFSSPTIFERGSGSSSRVV
jgi:hypothetical protein